MSANPLNSKLAQVQQMLASKQVHAAEAACRSILLAEPANADALHLLGLAKKEAGDLATAETLLRQSIAIAPQRADFHSNLGNLLRRASNLAGAAESYQRAIALEPRHRTAAINLVRTLNDLRRHSEAESNARRLVATYANDPQAWSALAMTLRDQNRWAEAEESYRRSVSCGGGAAAHHNLASVLLQSERTEEALHELERARILGAPPFELEFNRGRALVQLYRVDEAEHAFLNAVKLNPLHADAQVNLARVRHMKGDPDFAAELERTASQHPQHVGLKLLLASVFRRAGDMAKAEQVLFHVSNSNDPQVHLALAQLRLESGRPQDGEVHGWVAYRMLANDAAAAETLTNILLVNGKADDAREIINQQRRSRPHDQGWIAYEATAARLLGDPLYNELYDYDRYVHAYDIETPPGWSSMAEFNAALAKALAPRHCFVTHPLDQSLRQGTQTARSLVMDPDPAIRAALSAFARPIDEYRRSMGDESTHPLTSRNRGDTTFAGAWSVQLRCAGFHVNHFHPQGWISSAYYVSVPEEVNDEDTQSGWLKFGEPRFATPGAGAEKLVRPQAGRLVLFPSYMWHGTNPIHGSQPRLTIAFDAIPQG